MNHTISALCPSRTYVRRLLALAFAGCAATYAGLSHAQSIIKQPGNHVLYSVDLEPHAVFGWDDHYYGGGAFGLGMRATIPFLRNGPISTINNDMGIGFGLDWVTRGSCNRGYYYGGNPRDDYYFDCSAYAIYLPVVLQWNFYITDIITVYGEPGFAIRYAHVGVTLPDEFGVRRDYSNGYTDPIFVMSGGAKFMFGRTVGLNVRVGYPYFTVGASILL
jgi:hypothetical protein